MNYKQEVERLIREIVKDDSLSDVENDMLYNMALIMSGQTLNDFAADLEIGVKNGYSIEDQKRIISNIIKES